MKKYKELESKLKRYFLRKKLVNAGKILFHLFYMLFFILTFSVFFEIKSTLSINVKTLIQIFVTFYVLLKIFAIAKILIKPIKLHEVGVEIEKQLGEEDSYLPNAVFFSSELKKEESPYSGFLLEHGLDKAFEKYSDHEFVSLIGLQALKKYFVFACVSILIFSSMFLIYGDSFILSCKRLITVGKVSRSFLKAEVKVLKHKKIVLKGTTYRIEAEIRGHVYTDIKVAVKALEKVELYNVEAKQSGEVTHIKLDLPDVNNDFAFSIFLNKEYYGNYKVRVLSQPRIEKLIVRYRYPEYTGIKDEYEELNNQSVTALRGSKMSFTCIANREVKSFSILSGKKIEITGKNLEGNNKIKFSSIMTEHGDIGVSFTDEFLFSTSSPYIIKLTCLDDRKPEIKILYPGKDINLPAEKKIELEISATDDFGIKNVELIYAIDDLENNEALDVKGSSTKFYKKHMWDLSTIDVISSTDIVYWVRVTDNDVITGPKSVNSKIYRITVQSDFEKETDFYTDQSKTIKELKELKKDQDSVIEKARKILEKNKTTKKVSWKDRNKLKNLKKKQEELIKRAKEIKKNFEESLKKLQKNNMIDPDMKDKISKIRKLFKEIMDNKFKERLKSFQDLMKKLKKSMKLTKQDVDKFKHKFDRKKMKKELERMIKLMKKIRDEKMMDALVKESEKLLEEQKKINKKLDELNKKGAKDKKEMDELSKKQKDIAKQLKKLKKSIDELNKSLSYKEKKTKEKLMMASELMKKEKMSEQAEMNSQDIKKGDIKKSQKQGKKMEQDLKKLASSLKKAKKTMQQQRKKNNMSKIDAIAELLFIFSFRMEDVDDLINQNAFLKVGAPSNEIRRYIFDRWAKEYYTIKEKFAFVTRELVELSSETFLMNSKIVADARSVEDFLSGCGKGLKDKNLRSYRLQSDLVTANLNKLILELLMLRKQMQSSGSGTGMEQFMKSMEQMMKQQQQLMQKTQAMLNKFGSFQNMPQGYQDMLKEMAMEQQMIREQMEKLSEQMGQSFKYSRELNELGKKMKELEEAFRKGKIGQDTVEKQKKVIEKMLETTRSIHKKKFSKKRKSKTGKKYSNQKGNFELQGINEKRKLKKFKAIDQDTVPAVEGYENLLQEYFKAINEYIEK